MTPRLQCQNCKVFTALLSRNFQKRLEHKENQTKYRKMTRKPLSHVKILLYRTWAIGKSSTMAILRVSRHLLSYSTFLQIILLHTFQYGHAMGQTVLKANSRVSKTKKIGQFPRLLSKKGRVIYTLNESSKSLQTIPPCIFHFFFLALTRIQSPLFSAVALVRPPFLTHFLLPSYQQSSKKSASADVDEGPALLKYNGKDARFKDEKDLKVGLLEIPPWT